MIDAYTHCGLSKYEPVETVWQVMSAAGVERGVLVQHLGNFDNDYIEQVVGAEPDRFVGVALVDGSAQNWPEELAAVASSSSFSALRLTDEAIRENPELPIVACELGLDLVLYLPTGVASIRSELEGLASSVIDRLVVITHLGCPQLTDGEVAAGWELLELADLPNIMVTLSGLGMYCSPPHRPLEEFVTRTIETFTSKRLMWGSNFPVCGGSDSYRSDLELVLGGRWGLSAGQIAEITEQTADRVFFSLGRSGETPV